VLHSRQRGDILVAWREMADRVGRAGVTGERERLAAAAALSLRWLRARECFEHDGRTDG
jgi:hypothetical protein